MKKEEVTITFYAAECGEFHDFGEYTKCKTLEEAYKSTRSIVEHLPICVRLLSFLSMIRTLFIRIWNIHCRCHQKTGGFGACAILQRASTGK